VPWSLTLAANKFKNGEPLFVAVSVRLHGARPWNLQKSESLCSNERETPRHKAVASSAICRISSEHEIQRATRWLLSHSKCSNSSRFPAFRRLAKNVKFPILLHGEQQSCKRKPDTPTDPCGDLEMKKAGMCPPFIKIVRPDFKYQDPGASIALLSFSGRSLRPAGSTLPCLLMY
jgi:hypothetical protein